MATDFDASLPRTALGSRLNTPTLHNAVDAPASDETTNDRRLADEIAAKTETPREAAIDAANGLRGHGGRKPTPADFEGLLTPAGNSGDVVGSDVTEGTLLDLGEDGATKGTLQDR